ncbi:hypothetical protein ACFOUP_09455 [Belliella kenyensis]|uniref:Uncharacterized protein n=1 Tax=Belliella kenyensis TaxID=1472724 RepID=A0ABV8EKP9_9BACT|nr:hypothetical protein [Belliella kenyensis]MCH7403166.1 hypothetical protein [Belliella kenyensis]MDN3604777.1 hypothetical protein [Belliella kenyensis]
MKKKTDFKLIEGEFSGKEAKEILNQLFSDKINFHVKKSFNSSIKYGTKDLQSEDRIKFLKEEVNEINSFFEADDYSDQTYLIEAKVIVKPLSESSDKDH